MIDFELIPYLGAVVVVGAVMSAAVFWLTRSRAIGQSHAKPDIR